MEEWLIIYVFLIISTAKLYVTTSDGEDGFRYDRLDYVHGFNMLNFIFNLFVSIVIFTIIDIIGLSDWGIELVFING